MTHRFVSGPFVGLGPPSHFEVIRGHCVSPELRCHEGLGCPPVCQGGFLTIGDVTVRLGCAHAANLVLRVGEAIDASVLGPLPHSETGRNS